MPTIGKAVQFRGISDAVNAFENYGAPAWALFVGTQFLQKYNGGDMEEGKELLKKFLESFDQRSANTTTYTLMVYDDLPKNAAIKSNTPYSGSFNFRLQDDLEEYRQGRTANGLDARIAGIENKLDAVLNPPEEQEEPEELTGKDKFFDVLGKIIEHPQIQTMLAGKLAGIIEGASDKIAGMFKTSPANFRPAGIGSTGTGQDQGENEKLNEALQILAGVDPDLGTHLLKLARVAQSDPAKYKNLVGMLNFL
jgi:hypothetical protein